MDDTKHTADLNRPDVHHEESDVSVPGVVRFAVALVVLCLVALGLLGGLFKFFDSQIPLAPQVVRLPPEPRLEQSPPRDLAEIRMAEEHLLTGYSWVDQSKGVVRIPVDRAMDLLIQRGLPSRPQPPELHTNVSIPSESSLGNTLVGDNPNNVAK
jgi:hypothetical protein